MAKKWTPDSHLSFRLEEPIDVNYHIIGRPRWVRDSIPASELHRTTIVRSRSDLDPFRQAFKAALQLGVDTESSGPLEMDGLDAVSPSSELVLGQIGTPDVKDRHNKVIEPGRVIVMEPLLMTEFIDVLQGPQRKILQNAVHDFRFMMAKFGIHMTNMYCTMLAEQVISAGREGVGVGLADLVRKYRPNRIVSKAVRNEFIKFSGRFTPRMLYYAARDVSLMFPVHDLQQYLLGDYKLEKIARREFDIIPVMAEMGLTGVYCDATYLRQTIAYYLRMQEATIAKIFEIYNRDLTKLGLVPQGLLGPERQEWNLKSHQETRERLRVIGIDVEKTDYDTMIQLDHPIGKPLADLSGYTKILDNYGETMLERIHWHTGRIHSNIDQLGAGEHAQRGGKDKKATIATGRMSGDLQQLPRPEKIMALLAEWEQDKIRAAFIDRILAIQEQAQKKAA